MKEEEKATDSLAGGIMYHGYQCGMLWGAALAAGARAYQLYGSGPQAEIMAIATTRNIVKTFSSQNKDNINCLEITDINMEGRIQPLKVLFHFFIKGQTINCINMAVKYARKALDELYKTYSNYQSVNVSGPVSCSSMVAEKLKMSPMHIVMAAGFAGGIGLSGGGCGALGTAIWNAGIKSQKAGESLKETNARMRNIINKFLKATNYEFECSEICGKKFSDTNDHALYLKNGGCNGLIELLATV